MRMTIGKSLDAVLSPLAFERQGETWNRRVGGVIEVVDVQRSRVTSVTVNVGVMDLYIYQKIWRTPPPAFARDAASCAVKRRLVNSVDGGEWWPTAPIPYDDIAGSLSTIGLKFLERMRDRNEQIDWLAAPPMLRGAGPHELLHLSYAYQSVGRTADACEIVKKYSRRVVGAWTERMAELPGELGCC
jgi:hypothetical protein